LRSGGQFGEIRAGSTDKVALTGEMGLSDDGDSDRALGGVVHWSGRDRVLYISLGCDREGDDLPV
jgi:hypothetical protein